MSESDAHDCPLCMEAFEIDDLHFYPCTCGYQICRFCWHRIRTDGNALCPACRKTYTEDPAMYRALSHDEIQKVKKERKQKEAQHKQKISDNRQHLSNIRVIQRHLVFVVGLSNKMADVEVLKRPEYFGNYGKIMKIVINPNTNYAGPQGPSASAYITYTKEDDALKAILAINEMQPPLKIRASLGTTKYCTHYLRNMQCPKTDCMYLHDVGDPSASFTKEDMQAGKHQLFEKNLLDNYVARMSQLESQESYEDYEDGSDQLDTNSQEDWGEEETEIVDNTLPSKASWGTNKDEKNINNYMNEPSPTEYPVLEPRKPSPKQVVVEASIPVIPSQPDISRPVTEPITTPKSISPIEPVAKPRSMQSNNNNTQNNNNNNNNSNNNSQNNNNNITQNNNNDNNNDNSNSNNNISINTNNYNNSNNNNSSNTSSSSSSSSSSNNSNSNNNNGNNNNNNNKKNNNNKDIPNNIQKDGVINSGFSTGWATSYESPIVEPENINNNNNFLWPTTSDLGLSDLKINPSDDDLGFDPFNESKSGLEDLMASEKQVGQEATVAPQPPSFSWDTFWPSNYGSSQSQLSLMNSYSLFGASQPSSLSNPHMSQYRPPSLNQYPTSPMAAPSNPLQMLPPNTNQFRFTAPHQAQQQRFPIQLPNSNPVQKQAQLPPQQFMNQYRFPQSSSQGPPPHIPTPPSSQTASASSGGISTDNKNWQDGLRALLPNINISFSNQQLEKKLSEKWSSVDTPQQSAPAALPEVEKSTVSSPPPGFKGFSALGGEAKPSWIPSVEKTGPRPSPPPGFGKPNDTFPSHPQSALLSTPSGLHNTPVPNNYNPTNTSTVASTSQETHDDPSILWSKVLKDVPKEIETTDMAFPLPGENLKAGPSLEPLHGIPPAPPSSNHLTSWNTIVSGSQAAKGQMKAEDESIPINKGQQQPLQILVKENVEPPPQKSPIFGSQQKQYIKQKPTATVKPLKLNAPLDGFTTVQNSRQTNSQSAAASTSSNASTGSRVSELDDFSADLSSANLSNVINSLTEYPLAAATLPAKSGTKKKKRKGKDQIEQVAEVTVGRVETERPPVTILEDERPKKAGKAKKKAGMKVSPPPQRKSPPTVQIQKAKEQPQPIRILKSDGNAGTTMLSPAQVSADSAEAAKTVNSGNHDHEIVSRLTESTEKLLKNVLFETEAIKLNTEQISKDLKSALEKCKESSLSLSDLEKINLLLTPGKLPLVDLDDPDMVDTYDLERQVESARREAKMLEARLNDVIRKNMASELETLKRNTKNSPQ